MYLLYFFWMCITGKFDPAAGLAQSGIAGTGPPEPPDDTATSTATTPSVPAGVAAGSPHSAASDGKKDEQEKSKDAMDVEPSQVDVTKKEDESKETEEDAKSTDPEAAEAKEKKDKVNCNPLSLSPSSIRQLIYYNFLCTKAIHFFAYT